MFFTHWAIWENVYSQQMGNWKEDSRVDELSFSVFHELALKFKLIWKKNQMKELGNQLRLNF